MSRLACTSASRRSVRLTASRWRTCCARCWRHDFPQNRKTTKSHSRKIVTSQLTLLTWMSCRQRRCTRIHALTFGGWAEMNDDKHEQGLAKLREEFLLLAREQSDI